MTVLGIHTPESKGEADVARLKEKAKESKLDFAIAVDNAGKTWEAWGNHYWPSTYLIDKKGNVRYRWDGELNYQGIKGEESLRKKIEELIAEKD